MPHQRLCSTSIERSGCSSRENHKKTKLWDSYALHTSHKTLHRFLHHLIMDLPPRQLNASWDLVRSTHPTEMTRQPEHLIHNLTEVDPLLTAMRQETLRIQQLIDVI
jgi:hypothetical protein